MKKPIDIQREKQHFISQYKLNKGCENPNCQWQGEFTAKQLELNHLCTNTKHNKMKYNGNTMKYRKSFVHLSWKDLKQEINKCEVLCANCHRIK